MNHILSDIVEVFEIRYVRLKRKRRYAKSFFKINSSWSNAFMLISFVNFSLGFQIIRWIKKKRQAKAAWDFCMQIFYDY